MVAATAAMCIAAPASAQQTRTLKMQSTWPASLTLQDNFKMVAERIGLLTSGQIKIEALAAGQVVPPFEILDATHKKVIDGGHGVAYYWVGKNKTATLFSATPAGPFGMDHFDFLGWLYEGGGMELYWEFYRDIIKLDVVAFPVGGSSPQAFGWFKRPIKNMADLKGLKCRQTGIVNEIYTRMGMTTVNLPGGEIIPAAQRGVIDCAEWVGGVEDLRLGLPTGVQVSLHAGHAREQFDARAHHQQRCLEELHAAAAGCCALRDVRHFHPLGHQVAEAERRRDRRDARQAPGAAAAHAAGHPDRVHEDLGQDGR